MAWSQTAVVSKQLARRCSYYLIRFHIFFTGQDCLCYNFHLFYKQLASRTGRYQYNVAPATAAGFFGFCRQAGWMNDFTWLTFTSWILCSGKREEEEGERKSCLLWLPSTEWKLLFWPKDDKWSGMDGWVDRGRRNIRTVEAMGEIW